MDLVTGGTGFIGKNLIKTLAENGRKVHVLYRNESKIAGLEHRNIRFFKGDVTEDESLRLAMEGCERVYHLAAFANIWSKDPDIYEEVNFKATVRVADTALVCGVRKVVFVSTAGVFGPSENNAEVNETSRRSVPYFSEYEKTKDKADLFLLKEYSGKIDLCIVHPTRVFGPGELSVSNSVTKIIAGYSRGRFRTIPGNGSAVGNYVFVEDVVKGIILAMEKGRPGERYILGGENISFNELFGMIGKSTGKSYKMIRLPASLIIIVSYVMKLMSLLGIPPLITPGWARKYLYNWHASSAKAEKELGYDPRPVAFGIERTVEWLRKRK